VVEAAKRGALGAPHTIQIVAGEEATRTAYERLPNHRSRRAAAIVAFAVAFWTLILFWRGDGHLGLSQIALAIAFASPLLYLAAKIESVELPGRTEHRALQIAAWIAVGEALLLIFGSWLSLFLLLLHPLGFAWVALAARVPRSS
jgi:multisubunit Na+/H+ antiporter MnhB subunit